MRKASLAALATCALTASCFPNDQCNSSSPFVDYCGTGDPDCQGQIIDGMYWSSGPSSGAWLPFGPEQQYLFHFRDAVSNTVLNGQVIDYQIFIAAAQAPDGGSGPPNFVPCAGNVCEITDNTDGSSVFVKNDTCAPYFVRVVFTVIPNAPPVDAGTE